MMKNVCAHGGNSMKKLVSTKNLSREQWLQYRKQGLGGSDIGAIVGVSPFKSAFQVYIDKTTETIDDYDNEALRQGRDLESYIASRFEEETGMRLRKSQAIWVHDKYNFMLGDFDRVVIGKRIGVEIKTVSPFASHKWKENKIPWEYQLQVQHYLAISNFECWYICAMVYGTELIIRKIERDEELIKHLIIIEKRFWEENVLAGVMPEPDGSKQAGELLAKYYPTEKGKKAVLTEDISLQLRRREELADLIKKMETEKKTIEQSLLKYLGENDSTEAENTEFFVRWSSYTTARVDADRLRKEEPEIYERFKKISPVNKLMIKTAA